MTLHVIFNDDAITTDFIKPESVDLIVTSPPYNLEKDYGDRHDDSLPYADYLHFTYGLAGPSSLLAKARRPSMCKHVP